MLHDRVNLLMNVLNASCADLARLTHRSPSSFSRIRSGSRVPPPTSLTIRCFAKGMYQLAEETGQLEKLRRTVQCDTDGETVSAAILWLYADHESIAETDMAERVKHFHWRLDMLMLLADMNNVRLAQEADVDYSYVSRMHRGERVPKTGSDSLRRICDALFRQIRADHKLDALVRLTELEPDVLRASTMRDWLCGFTENMDFVTAKRFLQNLETVSLRDENSCDSAVVLQYPVQSFYYGMQGLRDAVTRFLSEIREGEEILLYSDHPIEWMTGGFQASWSMLMRRCVSLGVRFRIIHNVDRTLPEMLAVHQNWLSLYQTGMIEPFYSEKPRGSRFCHTMFLCPGHAAITGYSPEDVPCEFSYVTDTERLRLFHASFEHILRNCTPLLSVLDAAYHPAGNLHFKQFGNMEIIDCGETVVVNKLSEPAAAYRFYHPNIVSLFKKLLH